MDVSVIVPFYKGNKYINNVLKMIKRNAFTAKDNSIELIIVNDSPNVKIEYNNNYIVGYDFKIITHNTNMGIQKARITGISVAKGTYILMLDQDDVITDDAIQSQMKHIGDNAAVLSNGYSEKINGDKLKLYKNARQMNFANDFSYYFYFGNMIASPGLCLIRKDAIPKVWLNNIMKINGADDWLLWVSFLNDNYRFAINNKFLYIHKNDGLNTSNDEKNMLDSSQEALDLIKDKNLITAKYLSIYQRRLDMRKQYYNSGVLKKIFLYFKNIDIGLYVMKFKII